MPEIQFVDVRDRSGLNRNLIRRHAAEDAHRRRRVNDVFRYQNLISPQTPLALRPGKEHESPQDGIAERDLAERSLPNEKTPPKKLSPPSRTNPRARPRDPKSAMTLRWRVYNPTAIRPPTDDLKIEFVLSESFNWMMGQYTSSWSSSVQRDPKVFDLNGEVEILREAFYVVTDLLAIGKTAAAFEALKVTLDAMPAILRDPHPELLFTLVELAYGINMTGATDLHSKIRPHVAELAATVMGANHPLTNLLKSEFDPVLQNHVTELVFKCIVDAMSKTFGRVAYQTLVQQMGRSQFYARTGRGLEAQDLIMEIQEHWKQQYGINSALARLAELELCLMRLQDHQNPAPALHAQANNAMLRIEVMAGAYTSKFTDKTRSGSKPVSKSSIGMALAQWFLQNKRYSFALHCYERAKKAEITDGVEQRSQRPLADLIANTVAVATFEMLQQSENFLILPSQAPMQESVPATS